MKKKIEDVFAFVYINLRRMIEIFVRDLDVVVLFSSKNICVYADWKCEKDKCLSFILEIRANDLWSCGACVSVGVSVVLFMRMINSNMHSAAAATFKWNWCSATQLLCTHVTQFECIRIKLKWLDGFFFCSVDFWSTNRTLGADMLYDHLAACCSIIAN